MEELLVKYLPDLGLAGIIIYIAYKAISKLYADMRADATRREEKLMTFLDKVTGTLDIICGEMSCIKNRMTDIENKLGGMGHGSKTNISKSK